MVPFVARAGSQPDRRARRRGNAARRRCPAVGQSADPATASPPLAGAPLLAALRSGGYVLYFRHTSTDFGQNDEQMTGYEDCARQRNLTEAGRAEARAIGAAIRALRIPIGEVLASPFCRTRETAELMFGRATPATAVRGGPAQADDDRYAELKALLATPVGDGVDLAIVSHGNPYRAVVGGPYLAEGEVGGHRSARRRRLSRDRAHPRGRMARARSGTLASERTDTDAIRHSIQRTGAAPPHRELHLRHQPHAQLLEPALPYPRKPPGDFGVRGSAPAVLGQAAISTGLLGRSGS